MHRIKSLESLRGLLALWVVVGHCLQYSGVTQQQLWPFSALAHPGLAVDDFVILSGFVIFYLLDHQPVSYGQFLRRRFFRLAPMFALVLVVSALTLDLQMHALRYLPWPSSEVAQDLELHQRAKDFFFLHLLAHGTMLHGLFSNHILPGSSYVFLLQGWSISVEWQFYIVAPLVFLLVAQRRWALLVAFIAVFCVLRWINYGDDGFAPNRTAYFIIGIASYYAYRWISRRQIANPAAIEVIAITAIACLYMLLPNPISLIIWATIMSVIIAERQGSTTLTQKVAQAIFHHPVLLWLGRISYSVYLVHLLLFYVWAELLLRFWPSLSRGEFLLIMLPSVVISTLAVATASFTWIEKPGLALARGPRINVAPSPLPARTD